MKHKPETPEDLLLQDFTGDCYSAAYRWVSATKGQGWTLVHATVFSLREEKRIGHAWCERGEEIMDLAMPVGTRDFKRDKYYELLKPESIKRYTDRHAVMLFIRNQHYGPWEESEQLPDSLLDGEK